MGSELQCSKADKMFEVLGYTQNITKNNEFIIYSKKELKYKQLKEWEISINFDSLDKAVFLKNKPILALEELQAINEKCKELGWIE